MAGAMMDQAGKLLSTPKLKAIAAAHGTGTAQVVLAWQVRPVQAIHRIRTPRRIF